MRLGLWNIDHPEFHPGARRRHRRFHDILSYLTDRNCDILVLTEANAAMHFPGYQAIFSAESPFRNKSRRYEPPNRYHQVAIYSRLPITRIPITEPVNGLLAKTIWQDEPLWVYGNVITIKDRWSQTSHKTYSHRLQEQMDAMEQLAEDRFIVAGDFNLRLGWTQKKSAYERLSRVVREHGWVWPTRQSTDTVQHVIHSPDLIVKVTMDSEVQHTKGKKDGLSDHPFLLVEITTPAPGIFAT